MHPFYYFAKKYPSWCTCCIQPKYFKNKFDAYYHIKRKMAPKKQKPKSSPSAGTSSNEQTPQSIGKKRSAPKSRELELFYANCDEGGIIFNDVLLVLQLRSGRRTTIIKRGDRVRMLRSSL